MAAPSHEDHARSLAPVKHMLGLAELRQSTGMVLGDGVQDYWQQMQVNHLGILQGSECVSRLTTLAHKHAGVIPAGHNRDISQGAGVSSRRMRHRCLCCQSKSALTVIAWRPSNDCEHKHTGVIPAAGTDCNLLHKLGMLIPAAAN